MRQASWGATISLVVLVVVGSASSAMVAFAQDHKPAKKVPVEDEGGRPERQLSRAWTTALRLPPNRAPDRMTVIPGQGLDEQDNILAIFEYVNTGDLGIFYGGPDAASDRYVVLDKGQRNDLEDILLHPRKAK